MAICNFRLCNNTAMKQRFALVDERTNDTEITFHCSFEKMNCIQLWREYRDVFSFQKGLLLVGWWWWLVDCNGLMFQWSLIIPHSHLYSKTSVKKHALKMNREEWVSISFSNHKYKFYMGHSWACWMYFAPRNSSSLIHQGSTHELKTQHEVHFVSAPVES